MVFQSATLLNKKPLLRRIREYPEPEGTREDQKSHIQYILFIFFSYSFPRNYILSWGEKEKKRVSAEKLQEQNQAVVFLYFILKGQLGEVSPKPPAVLLSLRWRGPAPPALWSTIALLTTWFCHVLGKMGWVHAFWRLCHRALKCHSGSYPASA